LVGWLSGFRAQTGSVAYWSYANFVRGLCEVAAPGGGEWGPCPEFASKDPSICLTTEGKITENLSQGSRMALGCTATNAIGFVDVVIAGEGLDWPAVPCRPWLSRQSTR
jgi:hypothetical protein